jgi:hypothetical protein
MSYTPNIPQPTDQLSVSQGQMLGNFVALGAIGGNSNFGSASINGSAGFNFLFLANQGSIPPTAFVAGNVALYNATDTATTQNELYISKTNFGGAVKQVAATESILGVANPTVGASGSTGWTMLPSGIKMVWGTATSVLGPTLVTLTGNQAFATTILSVQATVIINSTSTGNAVIRLVNFPSTNSFNVIVTNANGGGFVTDPFMYLAIGY